MGNQVLTIDPSTDNKLSFRESINDVYVDLSTTYANLVAYLYDCEDNIVTKFSRETQAGYETIFAPSTTQADLYIERGTIDDYIEQNMILEWKSVEDVASRNLGDNQEHLLTRISLKVQKSNMGTAS